MKYESIIDIEHFEPKNHVRMSIQNRSAQFAPFSALTGYEEAIKMESKITEEKITLDEDAKSNIDLKLQIIDEHINKMKEVKVIYFLKDKIKNGGKYIEYIGNVKKIDSIKKIIIFEKNVKIKLDDVFDILLDF